MHIRHRPIDEIREEDLLELVQYADSETKKIDYKRELPKNDREGTVELLSDVSSFANASGGHLIYGLIEDKGIPIEPAPISLDDPDKTIQRLENKIRDGIKPRIQNVEIGEVRFSPSGFAIVIRIPRSWNAPHRVTFGGHDKFYSRNSRGKYPLNVHELRTAFVLAESITDKVRSFRNNRVAAILESKAPMNLGDGVKLVLHLAPLDAFALAYNTDIKVVASKKKLLEPMGLGGSTSMYNLEGYLLWRLEGYTASGEYVASAYTQYFRNGCIESVRVMRDLDEDTIQGRDIEQWIQESLPSYLELLKNVGINPPILIMVSLIRVYGYKIGVVLGHRSVITSHSTDSLPFQGITKHKLLIPEVMLQDYEDNIATLLHPVFETIWNAGGWPKSPLRDEQMTDNSAS